MGDDLRGLRVALGRAVELAAAGAASGERWRSIGRMLGALIERTHAPGDSRRIRLARAQLVLGVTEALAGERAEPAWWYDAEATRWDRVD